MGDRPDPKMDWRTYLTLGRVSNLPTVWTNVLAATVLVGASPAVGTLIPLFLSLSLFYAGGMFLNDAFDHRWDAERRPDRPIPAGLISARRVFSLGFAMLTAGVLVAVLSALPDARATTALAGTALAATIVAYDRWHKGNPLSPVVMGATRGLVYLTAGLAAGGVLTADLLAGALVLLSYIVGLTFAAKQETLGAVRNWWPLLFLAVPFAYTTRDALVLPSGVVLFAALLGCVVYALWLLFGGPTKRIGRAVVVLIAGVSLLDGVLMAAAGATDVAWMALLGFGLTLALQRVASGT